MIIAVDTSTTIMAVIAARSNRCIANASISRNIVDMRRSKRLWQGEGIEALPRQNAFPDDHL
jgi:hypothetical protein